MTRLADRTVAIVGGGIGGLTVALAFAQAGARVTVYEQAHALTEVGAGLQITPNGARVLDALGVSASLYAVGVSARAVHPVNAMTGRTIARFDLTQQRPEYRFYHRADLLAVLAQACTAAGVQIVLGARLSDVGVDGTFTVGGDRHAPDLTVGADGLHSVARVALNGPSDPFFTGQVAWRAVIPAEDAPNIAQIWMAPGRHVVTYPMRDGALNIVAVREREEWAEEGWHISDDPGHLQDAFQDVCTDLFGILQRVKETRLWGLHRHPIAASWSRERLVILGDAAHPTLPFLAQGANLAIEDAYVLVAALQAQDNISVALQVYEKARISRVSRAIDAANANARNYHLSGAQARIAHLGLGLLGRVAPQAFLNRLSWLYDHDVTAQNYQFDAV